MIYLKVRVHEMEQKENSICSIIRNLEGVS